MKNPEGSASKDSAAATSAKRDQRQKDHDSDGQISYDRSPMAKAMSMVGTITAISMSMVVMALIGWGLDNWLGTQIVFMFLGVVLGVVGGVWQLIKLLS